MRILLLTVTLILSALSGMAATSAFLPHIEEGKMVVSNRILARVNQKTISVIDVRQKMDLYLTHAYASQDLSPLGRSRFYLAHWREFLSQLVDQELILSDARYLQLPVSEKEVRERMLERFGPHVIPALDKIGLSHEKAKEMIRDEITVEKMTGYRVHAKAFRSIHPQEIKAAYKTYCQQNPPKESWDYQVLSLRSKELALAKETAEKADQLLHQGTMTLAQAKEKLLTENPTLEEALTLTASDLFQVQDRELSIAHREILQTLSPGSYSAPVLQVSRADQSNVYRIFFLKAHSIEQPPSFQEMEHSLRERAVDEAISKETALYIGKLRQRYGFDQKMIADGTPENFQPFSIE